MGGIKRQIGFPTANLEPEKNLIPKDGVYVIRIATPKGVFDGVLNIGTNPTFQGSKRTIEAHIFNFDKNLYGKHITIYFVERLRGEPVRQALMRLSCTTRQDSWPTNSFRLTAIEEQMNTAGV